MSVTYPLSSNAQNYGLGSVGGGTEAPARVRAVVLIGADPSVGAPSAAQYAASPWLYPMLSASGATGQVAGSMVWDLTTAGDVYIAKTDGTMIKLFSNGAVTAPLSNAAISINTISNLAGTTGTFYVSLTDNLADAFSIKEGSNSYLKFTTTNSSEAVVIGQPLSVAASFSSPVTGVQSIADNGTITLPSGGWVGLVATSSAANKTGVILTAGTKQGQIIRLLNTSANSLTFAAAGTSNVADGTGSVIAALTAVTFTWESGAARWFRG